MRYYTGIHGLIRIKLSWSSNDTYVWSEWWIRILASGLDGSMPLTVSWPPSRNHSLSLFLCLRLSPSRLYSTVNHCARLFIQDYIGYYALNVAIRFLPPLLSATGLSFGLVQIGTKKEARRNPCGNGFTQKNWKRHTASNGPLYLLAKRSLAFLRLSVGG